MESCADACELPAAKARATNATRRRMSTILASTLADTCPGSSASVTADVVAVG